MAPPARTDVHQHLWPTELLERLEARGAPLFVHPGPAGTGDRDGAPWWPALTGYLAGSDFPVLAADAPADDARVRENPARLLG